MTAKPVWSSLRVLSFIWFNVKKKGRLGLHFEPLDIFLALARFRLMGPFLYSIFKSHSHLLDYE